MCTGRIDLSFIFRSLMKGANGVFIGGCYLGECHYVTEGNFDAYANTQVSKKLLEYIGLNPNRLRIEWISASEGTRFAELMTEFEKEQKEIGVLGEAEGIDKDVLKFRLEAVNNLIPYIKLVLREKMRVPNKKEADYHEFFKSEEFNSLFNDLIASKLVISQIMLLLKEKPYSSREISDTLNIDSSDVSRYMNTSSRQGLVQYNVKNKSYTLA